MFVLLAHGVQTYSGTQAKMQSPLHVWVCNQGKYRVHGFDYKQIKVNESWLIQKHRLKFPIITWPTLTPNTMFTCRPSHPLSRQHSKHLLKMHRDHQPWRQTCGWCCPLPELVQSWSWEEEGCPRLLLLYRLDGIIKKKKCVCQRQT